MFVSLTNVSKQNCGFGILLVLLLGPRPATTLLALNFKLERQVLAFDLNTTRQCAGFELEFFSKALITYKHTMIIRKFVSVRLMINVKCHHTCDRINRNIYR